MLIGCIRALYFHMFEYFHILMNLSDTNKFSLFQILAQLETLNDSELEHELNTDKLLQRYMDQMQLFMK